MLTLYKPLPLHDLPAAKKKVKRLAFYLAIGSAAWVLFEFQAKTNLFYLNEARFDKNRSVGGLLFQIDNVYWELPLCWIVAKFFNTFDLIIGVYLCSFWFDMNCVYLYTCRNDPKNYDEGVTFMVLASVAITVIKCFLFVKSPRFRKIKIS